MGNDGDLNQIRNLLYSGESFTGRVRRPTGGCRVLVASSTIGLGSVPGSRGGDRNVEEGGRRDVWSLGRTTPVAQQDTPQAENKGYPFCRKESFKMRETPFADSPRTVPIRVKGVINETL